MRPVPFVLSTIFLALTLAIAADPTESRSKYNFNPDWLVYVGDAPGAEAPGFEDSSWKKVSLPYTWNEDSAFKVRNTGLPTGVAWYRKHFSLPLKTAGKKVFLEFEGLRQAGEIYLNGTWIGRSENGVMAFGLDITDKVKPAPQENVVAVRTDNSWKYLERDTQSAFQWNHISFYANFGGINKNVYLHVTDKLHQTLPLFSNLGTTGVYIYGQDYDIGEKSAKITAEAQVKNEHAEPKTFAYEVTIDELDGKPVKIIDGGKHTIAPGETKIVTASAGVPNLNFWSWGYGYLYRVSTVLKINGEPIDTVRTITGFRKLGFKNGCVELNDQVIHLKGYAQRSTNEWPALGPSVPPWMSDMSNGLMVVGNANLVRWMHVTPWKQDVESCDRVGIMQAVPAGDAEKDATGRQWDQRVELMRDAIIYNRNNPSIVFYECGNYGISEKHMAEMKALRDKYDPHGSRAIGARDMLDSKVAEYGGEMLYIDKSANIPLWMMEYARDEGLRKYWDDWTPPFHKDGDGPLTPKGESGTRYNRNQDSFAIEDVVRWHEYWRERPGTGERVNAGAVNIIFADTNTHARGAETFRRSGEVDAMRLPKDAFFAHQVMWDGWGDADNPRIHIIGHWNYTPDVRKPIYVISSADKVELFINDQSKGFGEQSSRFLYTWNDIPFQSGQLRAVGYDSTGAKICETTLETSGPAAAIKLTAKTGPGGLKADGADLALIEVEVVDAHGQRCPTAMNIINFELHGPAEWRGGIAQGLDNHILSKQLPVECGVNRVLIRSTPKEGKIALSATSPGLEPARIELSSVPFSSTGGLSATLPDDGLSPNFERGPTPPRKPQKPLRKTLKVVGAKAGANTAQTGQAFDDNEKTSWKNDGQRESGWIEFELKQPAMVSELVIKFGSWRRKSYPIRILLDGKEAFSGKTIPSLGYVTLPLQQSIAKKVRVELTGDTEDGDAFGMVEVTGKKLPDASDGDSSNLLEIIETEIYGPADK